MKNEKLVDLINQIRIKSICHEEDILHATGITKGELQLFMVFDAEKTYAVKELSTLANLSISRTSRIIDTLVENELIVRTESKKDRRHAEIVLTKKGRAIFEKIMEMRLRCENRLEKVIAKTELKKIKDSLQQLISSIESLENESLETKGK